MRMVNGIVAVVNQPNGLFEEIEARAALQVLVAEKPCLDKFDKCFDTFCRLS